MHLLKKVTVGVAAAVASLALAAPAHAESFKRDVGDGIIRYNDATNELCVLADNVTGTAWVEVTLTRPGTIGSPVVIRDDNVKHPGAVCGLLTGFDGVTFKASYESYWSGRGTILRGSFEFRS